MTFQDALLDVRGRLPVTLADEIALEELSEDSKLAIARLFNGRGITVGSDANLIAAYEKGWEDGVERMRHEMPHSLPAPSIERISERLARTRQ